MRNSEVQDLAYIIAINSNVNLDNARSKVNT